ncbi:MAG TPA: acyl-CoA ligase (AMP-forming), exosortase A system-associated [Accumulibacter sp.]|uniref:acyl-CoA ligase (AMP-forming), exosortase A system-associated n=1 Tax=Accumulibacter sp. TaxID=2053492 RepID=UPI002879E3CE|nr:acyl-CoA ligase (AMP-forming), exosortase A system-associated [Accumulibacter sp.]MDS4054950.1 acyl-CoA ligase (AMP-forming), exosortase A system-associated [Accumulibacter sp.]HMV04315.1 acyl-CoA ligase (AMP-forming), exosortase A system-associated [Accumulibacter sp.]HMW63384.1 acyl-CoA ligase (AMP-forming), exosortase A system-associated [Accumulibacter sp.]HMW80039.1 acyl-CoA ligase (AMP-forming), exosortase A system-associated [Accumulibacter sp.]HMX67729.1 acyl-CoA ligase (AMP-forming
MKDTNLLDELIWRSAARSPESLAVTCGQQSMSYGQLAQALEATVNGLVSLGLQRGERVAIYLEKRLETVTAMFAAAAAGCVFVPVNPLLKADQVGHILRDCNARALVTSGERLALLTATLAECPDLRHTILVPSTARRAQAPDACVDWEDLLQAARQRGHRVIDTDMVAILYTSGSTGKPKGVVLSHRNMVAGAKSVASYLENSADDTLLAALPLSFDAGFSQLTTAFHVGARVALLNYLLPQDVLKALAGERVTGLTAVPPLYIQLARLDWPAAIGEHLRYFANTGGRMPRETLLALRARLPHSKPFLMYGLTEAFRSTYLPPEEVDRRPDSIGKAIPNSEVLVLREDGSPCVANEPGELVHRGALVGMGYWNDRAKTDERYKPLPAHAAGRAGGLVLPEIAVFSGDTVRMDEEGFLYFVGRRDEMIKTSGYRVSPTEVEEVVYATGMVGECVAFGVEHPTLGQAIILIVTAAAGEAIDCAALLAECRTRMPAYMVPAGMRVLPGPLPRNPNGKIDRKGLLEAYRAGAFPDPSALAADADREGSGQ